jgi:hypothetical protein
VYGRFIVPGDELANADVFLAYRPAHAWLTEGLRQGRLPLWNPYLLGGFPLAFSEYGWFSPANWAPLVLFGPHAGYYVCVALYVAAAGLAAYALARAWGISPAAALLAGLVYGQSLVVVGGAPLLNQGAAYWALPALLGCVHWCFAGRRWAAPLLALLCGLTLLGSHPQLSLLVLLPPAVYAALRAGQERRWEALVVLGIAGALGAALSTVRFLPTLSLVAASERSGGLNVDASALGSVSPISLLAGFLLPSLAVPRVVSAQWTAYLGALPLALAAIEAGASWRRRWTALLVVLAGTGLVLALGSYTPVYAFLLRTPLFGYFREPSRFLLWTVLSIALLAAAGLERALAAPRRRRALLTFAVLVTALCSAAYGALQLLEPRLTAIGRGRAMASIPAANVRDYPPDHYIYVFDAAWRQTLRSFDPLAPGTFIPLVSLLAAGWWLWWMRSDRPQRSAVQTGLAIAVVTLPLLAYGQVRLPAIPAAIVREPPAAVPLPAAALADDPPAGGPANTASRPRVLSWLPLAVDYEVRLRNDATGGDADVTSYRLLRDQVAPNFGTPLHVPQVDGYENLMTREQALLAGALGSERATGAGPLALSPLRLRERQQRIGERWNLFIAAGGGLLLSDESRLPVTWPAAVRYEPRVVQGTSGTSLTTFTVAHPFPRAFVTPSWTTVSRPEEAAQVLISSTATTPGLPPVVVVDPAAQGAQGRQTATPPRDGSFDARIVAYGERRVEIATDADADALLVLLDAMAPGWTASVTGAPAPILTANVAFRAVRVPAGRHTVTFSYTPPYWRLGIGVTLAALSVSSCWLGLALMAGRAPQR